MNKINVDKIFIPHYTKLNGRRRILEPQLKNIHNNIEWYCEHDKEVVAENIEKYYAPLEEEWKKRFPAEIYGTSGGFRKLSMGEISLATKHMKIMEKIVSENIDLAMVLEDDVIIKEKEFLKFNELLEKTPKDFDLVYFCLNFPYNVFRQKTFKGKGQPRGHNVLKAYPPNSRTTDGYIITKEAAKKYIDNVKSIILPFDFEMNYYNWKLELNVYHWWPGICKQGTFFDKNKYKTSLK